MLGSTTNNLITLEQQQLLVELRKFESQIQFHSLGQIPFNMQQNGQNLSSSIIKKRSSILIQSLNESKSFEKLQNSNKDLQNNNKKLQNNNKKLQNNNKNKIINQTSWLLENLVELNQIEQQKNCPIYFQTKKCLLAYRQKSQQIYQISEYIKNYEQNFSQLINQKNLLQKILKQVKDQTNHLVTKQRKLIDLSIEIKSSLDYYTYHNRNQFNFSCQVSNRQLFENNLQSILSEIMDGIQFFQTNSNYIASKKHLNHYYLSKSKILSFIKSFYIKLLNKQSNFLSKYVQINRLSQQLSCLYPKTRLRLTSNFLLTFPQFKKLLKSLVSMVKDSPSSSQQITFLEMRQSQIQQFILSQSNISLIKFLEQNYYQIYDEVILNLFSFNRGTFHQALINQLRKNNYQHENQNKIKNQSNKIKNQSNKINNSSNKINNSSSSIKEQPNIIKEQQNNKRDQSQTKLQKLKAKMTLICQIVITEYLYFINCARPNQPASIDFIKAWIFKLALKYGEIILKNIKQIIDNKNVFEICQTISSVIKQIPGYLKKISSDSYQSYIIGCISHRILVNLGQEIAAHLDFLKQTIQSVSSRILTQLSAPCIACLPKLVASVNKSSVQQSINKLISSLPLLKYCQENSQSYMISSLDAIVKSIRQINLTMDSRFQCYSWNLVVFGMLARMVRIGRMQLVDKQLRIDFNQTLGVVQRVTTLQHSQGLLKYFADLFHVIRQGMPTLNQLTMDFNQYLQQHSKQLEDRFLKDILFIYAKNMVDFLQKMMELKRQKQQLKISSDKQLQSQQDKVVKAAQADSKQTLIKRKSIPLQGNKKLDPSLIKTLYTTYLLNIQRYISQSLQILQNLQSHTLCLLQNKQPQIQHLRYLINQVYQKLLDFLDSFYVILGQYCDEQENHYLRDVVNTFQEIVIIRRKHEKLWNTDSKSK